MNEISFHKTHMVRERFAYNTYRLNECLMWSGWNNGEYGMMSVNGEDKKATHVAWFLSTGVWPTGFMLHRNICPSTLCVGINHLYEGSALDNQLDREAKRVARGLLYCKRGHLLIGNSVEISLRAETGRIKRRCKVCRRKR